ncbi:MAG: thioredoxin family protein [bacterium]
MKKNKNLLIILLIFILPLALFYFKAFWSEEYVSVAQVFGSKPIVLDFGSEMCLECKELDKVMNPVKAKYKDKIVFKKISVNSYDPETEQLIKEYGVNVVPTLVFINKEGKQVKTVEGCLPQYELESYLKIINE